VTAEMHGIDELGRAPPSSGRPDFRNHENASIYGRAQQTPVWTVHASALGSRADDCFARAKRSAVALPLVPAVAVDQSRGPVLGSPRRAAKAAINEPEERLDGRPGSDGR
jgi:hypothetical protein